MSLVWAKQESALCDAMEAYSQEHFSATWLDDLEFELWARVLHNRSLHAVARSGELDEIWRLSEAEGGWVCWPHDEMGPCLVSAHEWTEIYARSEARP